MKAMKFILVFLGTALLGVLLFYSFNNPYYHMSYMMHGGGWITWIGFLIVICLVGVFGWYLLQQQSDRSTSLDHLKERLAKGEITIDEYNQIKDTIKGE